MKHWIYLLLILSSVNALEIDIIANFNIEELPSELLPIKQAFDVNTFGCLPDYLRHKSANDSNIHKIIIFNPYFELELIRSLPKEKLVLFVWEPEILPHTFYNEYAKVYTWDDTLIDNKKFFRFNYPYLMPLQENSIPLDEKKLCVMVTGHWTKERLDILRFFESNHPQAFECYGRGQPIETPLWKGAISGSHSGSEKISVLQKYRFCICFENTIGLQGYITEKIFSCFAAGCIPVYWGADNIERYIPKSCLIDYRDFDSYAELYEFLSTMSLETYQKYCDSIESYLSSEQAQIFSPSYFDALLYEAVSQ